MNYECSRILLKKGCGIFRSASRREIGSGDQEVPSEIKHIVQNVAGEYCTIDDMKPHELIAGGLQSYVHITSPIRRLVDCLNMLEIQRGTYINSVEANQFLEKWLCKVPLINSKTKAIRRLQNEVELLRLYERTHNQVYNGIVFAQTCTGTGTGTGNEIYKYKVYIPYIKLLTSVYSERDIKNYSFMDFTVHLFLDESKMSRKVRLQML